ncbi:DUF4846 domain-containing protein [Alkaliphilus transvaalensis]|uniref:DUF4846 domain-containing protein n=1 Tax=Alkaliphilus transvaalensis TaxID=114628 RepID=UPI000687ED65|nr:DUF4846 domain-containing protein [Alkaliphilus transvaalensis]
MKRENKKFINCITLLSILLLMVGCSGDSLKDQDTKDKKEEIVVEAPKAEIDQEENFIIEDGAHIETRILPPLNFVRVAVEEGSFGAYLRGLPLKPHGSPVLYYNGVEKTKSNVYMAVIDMEIGDRDLQQCADAIIRLRGEYLYEIGDYHRIHFNFTNGFRVDYSKWMEGYRIVVEGNRSYWQKRTEASNTYQDFRRYMDIIFAYAGTISLEAELETVDFNEMEIGDILIQGGSPGHAVIVVDMAINEGTGERLFLLAQSYMPAQETQILVNPIDERLSPWYSLDQSGDKIVTPEWTFKREDLKRFPE